VSQLFLSGERDAGRLTRALRGALEPGGLRIEYAELAGSRELERIEHGSLAPGEAGAFIAARVGTTRLIDNLILGVDPAPAVGPASGTSE
jgi:pantothenate synthetase